MKVNQRLMLGFDWIWFLALLALAGAGLLAIGSTTLGTGLSSYLGRQALYLCIALVAYLIFNGLDASTMAAGSVGKLSFELLVSPGLLWTGLKWALAIGFIGGLFPAVRAARLPVSSALREL